MKNDKKTFGERVVEIRLPETPHPGTHVTRHRPAVLPTHFQVLIEVEMIDIGAELVNVGPIL